MKIGFFTTPNDKGQIVIPKEIRDALRITSHTPLNLIVREGVIYIYPVSDIVGAFESENVYGKILERTRGAWREDKSWEKFEKQRKELEWKKNQENKKPW